MIPKSQLHDLIRKLRAKTAAGEVNWVPHDTDEFGCELLLPGSSVELSFLSPATDLDRVKVILNENDKKYGPAPVAEAVVAEGDPDWELFYGLYLEASKGAHHWDRVLGELESAVNNTGRIGLTHEQLSDVAVPATR